MSYPGTHSYLPPSVTVSVALWVTHSEDDPSAQPMCRPVEYYCPPLVDDQPMKGGHSPPQREHN